MPEQPHRQVLGVDPRLQRLAQRAVTGHDGDHGRRPPAASSRRGVEQQVEALLRGEPGHDDGERGARGRAPSVGLHGVPVATPALRLRAGRGDEASPVRRAPSRAHPLDEVGRDPQHQRRCRSATTRSSAGVDGSRSARRRATALCRVDDHRRRRAARAASTASGPARRPCACTTSAPPASRREVAHRAGVARRVRAVGRSSGTDGGGHLGAGRSAASTSGRAGDDDVVAARRSAPRRGRARAGRRPPALVPSTTSTLIRWLPPRRRARPRWRTCDIISRSPIDSATTPTTRAAPPAARPMADRLGQAVDGAAVR